MTLSFARTYTGLLLTIMVLRWELTGASTTDGTVSKPNVCTHVIQYPAVEVQNFTVRRTIKQRCTIGSFTDLFNGRCRNRYVTRYVTQRRTRNVTRLITRIEEICCNGTTEINGTCIQDGMPVLESTSNFNSGALVPILVIVVVVGMVATSIIVYICRRKNMYKKPREPKILGMTNAVYQIEKDKSTSNHTYVLPDDPSYLKLDSQKINRNVYETVPAIKAQTSAATGDDSYEKLNTEKEVAMNQNVYEQIKTYTLLNKK